MTPPPKVLLTDHPWSGTDIERDILDYLRVYTDGTAANDDRDLHGATAR